MDSMTQGPTPETDAAGEAAPPVWAEPRDLFFFRLGTLFCGDVPKRVEIVAMAESGAIVRTRARVDAEAPLRLEINSHHLFAARLAWAADDFHVLEFEDRALVREVLAARDRGHPYRPPRLSLKSTILLRLGETSVTARARDVSEGGIKVDLAEPQPVGSPAGLIVPGMAPLTGRVSWCRDGRTGIEFEKPLPFRALADCLTRSG